MRQITEFLFLSPTDATGAVLPVIVRRHFGMAAKVVGCAVCVVESDNKVVSLQNAHGMEQVREWHATQPN